MLWIIPNGDSKMDALQKIRSTRQTLLQDLRRLESQQEGLTSALQEKKRQVTEYDTAIRILSKECGEPEPEETTDISHISGKEAMLAVIRQNPGVGLKSREIRNQVQRRFGISIPANSASNYLWIIHQDGDIRREGHRWFPAEKDDAPPPEGEAS